MSLGSPYGPAPDDDLSAAVQNAIAAGTTVVASAGNSGDKPYVAGTPSTPRRPCRWPRRPSRLDGLRDADLGGGAVRRALGGGLPVVVQAATAAAQRRTSPSSTATAPVATSTAARRSPRAGSGQDRPVDRGTCTFSDKIASLAAGGASIGDDRTDHRGPVRRLVRQLPERPLHAILGYMVSQSTSNA